MNTDAPSSPDCWTDAARREWCVTLATDRVVLESGEETVDIPRDAWDRDISVATHGERFIVRFSTREHEIGFIQSAEAVEPLLEHIGRSVADPTGTPDKTEEPNEREGQPLLWPKVSPLSVWALCCSSLAFLPLLGVVPAVAAVVLLILHRKRVRRSRSWHHSRVLCRVATVLLVFGVVVHGLAAYGMAAHFDDPSANRVAAPTPVNGEWRIANSESQPPSFRHSLFDIRHSPLAAEPFWDRPINWGLLVTGLLVVIGSLSVHEAAHAISALWLGDDFPRRMGRVTLNPAAHIDPFGTVILPALLFIADMGVFGWARPVQVQVHNLPRPRRAHILISIAGPGSNLLLAAVSLAMLLFLGCIVGIFAPEARVENFAAWSFSSGVTARGFALAPVFGPVCTLLKMSFLVNVFLAFFNLIPIPPLDGSWVLENLFPFTVGRFYDRIRPYGLVLFVLLIYSGALRYLLAPVALVLAPGLALLDLATPF